MEKQDNRIENENNKESDNMEFNGNWKKNEKSESYKYAITGEYVTLRAIRQYDNPNYNLTGNISTKLKMETHQISLGAYPTKKDVEDAVNHICNQYELIRRLRSDYNQLQILKEIAKEINTSNGTKQSRLELTSNDGKYQMWVKKEGNSFIPRLKQVTTNKGGHLHPPVCTEEEANRIVENQMENYNIKGCFCRKNVNSRNKFEDECSQNKKPQGVLDDFLEEDTTSNNFHEKLLAVKEIIEELLDKQN